MNGTMEQCHRSRTHDRQHRVNEKGSGDIQTTMHFFLPLFVIGGSSAATIAYINPLVPTRAVSY